MLNMKFDTGVSLTDAQKKSQEEAERNLWVETAILKMESATQLSIKKGVSGASATYAFQKISNTSVKIGNATCATQVHTANTLLLKYRPDGAQYTLDLYLSELMAGNLPTRGLCLYYRGTNGDNFNNTPLTGQNRAIDNPSYTFVRVDGQIISERVSLAKVPNTKALMLYYSADRQEYIACADAATIRDVKAANYTSVGALGLVYTTQVAGTVPLKLFWSGARRDNFTTCSEQGERDALAAGYVFVRIEGYVYP